MNQTPEPEITHADPDPIAGQVAAMRTFLMGLIALLATESLLELQAKHPRDQEGRRVQLMNSHWAEGMLGGHDVMATSLQETIEFYLQQRDGHLHAPPAGP